MQQAIGASDTRDSTLSVTPPPRALRTRSAFATDTITSTLEAYDEQQGHSTMALYVGVPCGIAVQLMLDGKLNTPILEAVGGTGHGPHQEGPPRSCLGGGSRSKTNSHVYL
ncbi:hypothetical protein C8Q70DRAFT_1015685 [Cubamyces menziesii]|nr:hypothetical protein C8Q70DRAFT_1015685 [Cubamyces menziesii]